jgi:hypothetical protein
LSTARNQNPAQTQTTHRTLGAALALLVAASFATAQTSLPTTPASNFVATSLSLQLPDSPGFLASSSRYTTDTPAAPGNFDAPQIAHGLSAPGPNARTRHSSQFVWAIAPDEMAQPMSAHDKIVGGLRHSVSLFSATGWLSSAGWAQLNNGIPNYGTDKGAFGQRLGTAAIHGTSNGIFSSSIFAPLFHEDPRYYIMGRGNNFFKRAIYATTRTIITRTDDGHATPNFALWAGNAAGAALTVTYFPAKNTTSKEVAKTFGTSLGGSTVGFFVREFIGDALERAHLKKGI